MFSTGASKRRLGLAPLSLAAMLAVVLLPSLVEGRRTSHCYVCRSRGQLGDCRDPFPYNETTVEGVRGVEASPCASKWCGKLVEGRDEDFDLATERMCLQRPPDDLEERCAETLYQNRRVYMCFCRGDLCNGAHRTAASGTAAVVFALASAWAIRCALQL
ncbi:UPAR/Ly6 domain-containing protein rtv [Dermacentor albipictus]|uniref:UPAR/Ly6 domain-containing protein rtv n=1 Tax=Dermacentor albipictus TaxID=60249 RepID=UPI0038FCB281